MRMNAVLSNPKHPEYGQFTVPLPIPHNQYDGIMEALNAMDMGDPLARDCQMDEILGEYPILKRLEGKPVNIDELDYLAKRLDSFCYAQEGAQFQGAAVSYDYPVSAPRRWQRRRGSIVLESPRRKGTSNSSARYCPAPG